MLNKAKPTTFKLVFPVLPETADLEASKIYNIHLIDTLIPSISVSNLNIPTPGPNLNPPGGGIEYGNGNTNFYIDEKFENYLLMYNWMMSNYDGRTVFGSKKGRVNAHLMILDNYEKEVVTFQFESVYPMMLGDVDLSYQNGEDYLSAPVTFSYIQFYPISFVE